jgi:ATP-dependent RNA helicase RhlE
MLDLGFIEDIKKIMARLPSEKQSLFFSATMPPEIIKFAETILADPVKIEVAPEIKTVGAIKQAVYFVSKSDKKRLLVHILKNEQVPSALVFTRTKREADYITQFLNNAEIQADAIHSNKSQNARQRALNNFKSKKTKVLVATDIAARGIDIEKLSHVFNFDIPDYSENYIHRIGRTGRAGLSGTALSFCDNEEKIFLKDINKLIRTPIPVINDHPFNTIDQNSIEFSLSNPGRTKSNSFRSSRRSRYRKTRSRW